MTVTEQDPSSLPDDRSRRRQDPRVASAAGICPYVGVDDRSWRSSTPSHDHRCLAVTPAVALSSDKQRRLCLASTYPSCATFGAAVAHREAQPLGAAWADGVTRWSLTRTTPVVLEHGKLPFGMSAFGGGRRGGQLGLAALMLVALALVGVARLPSDASPAGARPSASPAPSASPSIGPTQHSSAVPSQPAPTADSEPDPSPTPAEPSAGPATPGATYVVRPGDSLTGIAARFGTTVAVLAELNGISDPARIRAGQVLQLP